MHLSSKIKELRKKHKMTQQDLIEKANISFSALTKLEQNSIKKPHQKTLLKIANAFEISVKELLND